MARINQICENAYRLALKSQFFSKKYAWKGEIIIYAFSFCINESFPPKEILNENARYKRV